MDFARFISILETESMWFARLDRLDGPLEGSMSPANLSNRREIFGEEWGEDGTALQTVSGDAPPNLRQLLALERLRVRGSLGDLRRGRWNCRPIHVRANAPIFPRAC